MSINLEDNSQHYLTENNNKLNISKKVYSKKAINNQKLGSFTAKKVYKRPHGILGDQESFYKNSDCSKIEDLPNWTQQDIKLDKEANDSFYLSNDNLPYTNKSSSDIFDQNDVIIHKNKNKDVIKINAIESGDENVDYLKNFYENHSKNINNKERYKNCEDDMVNFYMTIKKKF